MADSQSNNSSPEAKGSIQDAVLPPPPPPLPPSSRLSRPACPPPPPLPPGSFVAQSLSNLEKKFIMSLSPSTEYGNWEPRNFFFYGSLMDPEVLQTVLGLSELPTVSTGYIKGFKIKMWGIYPTLVPATENEDTKVMGTFWTVHRLDYQKRLTEYESSAYTTTEVTIIENDGENDHQGFAFCWAGAEDSPDLEDGFFDLARYQQYFKPSLLKRSGPAF